MRGVWIEDGLRLCEARGDAEVTVAFTSGAGVKRLLLSLAKLERID